ncbi:MAG: putative pyridoxine 5'-phosphate oxidase superfamily flavin-nucleotide-binding protein [Sulfurimonas sp.]|jgi:predicted pyridoxine 5'-phosphate oxidase superfamily flavin-nucleotide-binding protein|uniref:pyridoxamine 5'-phosphate oxidase family protein n=1 Tax=Sulfurimonas sp. TaxID=2022749 RepID=UPI0039E463F9
MIVNKNKAQTKYGTLQIASMILTATDTARMSKPVRELISKSSYFFLATASKEGKPNMNYKGGEVGFVHVVDETTIVFPDYDGNGILHGISDMMDNPNIAMLFIDFNTSLRFKVNGIATIIDSKEEVAKYLDYKGFDYAPRLIKVDVKYVLGNCSKNIDNVRKDILSYE